MRALLLIGVGAALLLAVRRAMMPPPAPPTPTRERATITLRFPPIPLKALTQQEAERAAKRLTPSVRPSISPPGWIVTFPPIEVQTGFGTAKFQVEPKRLPLIPKGEVLKLLVKLRPRPVLTADGWALQIAPITITP